MVCMKMGPTSSRTTGDDSPFLLANDINPAVQAGGCVGVRHAIGVFKRPYATHY
jgi:hypothetical protein